MTLIVAFKPTMELRDSSVVRPLFFTAWLIEAASVVFEIVLISRIEPLLANLPGYQMPQCPPARDPAF